MPELPEVETIKSDLSRQIVGHKITDVKFLWEGILKDTSVKNFKKQIIGQKIISVERRAKNISVKLPNDLNLLFHMKMTGHLIYTDDCWEVDKSGKWLHHNGKESPLYDPLNQFIRVIFYLERGKILAFSDLRKFAYIKIFDNKGLEKAYQDYGPEPFSPEFNIEYLKNIFSRRNIAVKKVLMDQKNIAGIGNIYADEILWEIKVHPETKASSLSDAKIKELFLAVKKILSKAIKLRGTSTSDFRDTAGKKGKYGEIRKAYRRTGLPCPRDKTPIKRITIGGRGTHFCPTCQRLTTNYK